MIALLYVNNHIVKPDENTFTEGSINKYLQRIFMAQHNLSSPSLGTNTNGLNAMPLSSAELNGNFKVRLISPLRGEIMTKGSIRYAYPVTSIIAATKNSKLSVSVTVSSRPSHIHMLPQWSRTSHSARRHRLTWEWCIADHAISIYRCIHLTSSTVHASLYRTRAWAWSLPYFEYLRELPSSIIRRKTHP